MVLSMITGGSQTRNGLHTGTLPSPLPSPSPLQHTHIIGSFKIENVRLRIFKRNNLNINENIHRL